MSGARSARGSAPIGAWVGLAVVLVVNRLWILHLAGGRGAARPAAAWLAVAAYQDLLLVAALAAVGGLARRRASRPALARAVDAIAVLVAMTAAAYAVLASIVYSYLGTPLTARLIELSDHLRGIRASLAEAASPGRIALLAAAPGVVALCALAATRWPRRPAPRRRTLWWRAAFAVFAAYVAVAAAATSGLRRDAVVSPHWAMLASLLARDDGLVLAPAGGVDLSDVRPSPTAATRNPRTGVAAGANVVVVVLESVGTKQLAAWGARDDVTPELTQLAARGVLFERIYAPQPRTSSAMAALFCSVHPWARRTPIVRFAPRLEVPGIAEVLAGRGYRTAFVHGGDLSFDREREFLEAHGFATVRDAVDFARPPAGGDAAAAGGGARDAARDGDVAATPRPQRGERLRGGAERADVRERRRARRAAKRRERGAVLASAPLLPDRLLLPAALRWIDADPGRPFLLVLWTLQTHHPYTSEGPAEPGADGNASLARYRAALRASDRVLGELRRELAARGLADSTLWVVVGDHGEAFGEHGHAFHGRSLYDEEVRVPLLLAHPRLEAGVRVPGIGQQTDVAPTILDLLGEAAPADWQGRSLFAPQRPERAYLANVFDDYLVGLVDGDRKLLFGELATRREVYDTARDLDESVDLSSRPEERDRIEAAHRRLAAWVRFQDDYLSARAGPAAGDEAPQPSRR